MTKKQFGLCAICREYIDIDIHTTELTPLTGSFTSESDKITSILASLKADQYVTEDKPFEAWCKKYVKLLSKGARSKPCVDHMLNITGFNVKKCTDFADTTAHTELQALLKKQLDNRTNTSVLQASLYGKREVKSKELPATGFMPSVDKTKTFLLYPCGCRMHTRCLPVSHTRTIQTSVMIDNPLHPSANRYVLNQYYAAPSTTPTIRVRKATQGFANGLYEIHPEDVQRISCPIYAGTGSMGSGAPNYESIPNSLVPSKDSTAIDMSIYAQPTVVDPTYNTTPSSFYAVPMPPMSAQSQDFDDDYDTLRFITPAEHAALLRGEKIAEEYFTAARSEKTASLRSDLDSQPAPYLPTYLEAIHPHDDYTAGSINIKSIPIHHIYVPVDITYANPHSVAMTISNCEDEESVEMESHSTYATPYAGESRNTYSMPYAGESGTDDAASSGRASPPHLYASIAETGLQSVAHRSTRRPPSRMFPAPGESSTDTDIGWHKCNGIYQQLSPAQRATNFILEIAAIKMISVNFLMTAYNFVGRHPKKIIAGLVAAGVLIGVVAAKIGSGGNGGGSDITPTLGGPGNATQPHTSGMSPYPTSAIPGTFGSSAGSSLGTTGTTRASTTPAVTIVSLATSSSTASPMTTPLATSIATGATTGLASSATLTAGLNTTRSTFPTMSTSTSVGPQPTSTQIQTTQIVATTVSQVFTSTAQRTTQTTTGSTSSLQTTATTLVPTTLPPTVISSSGIVSTISSTLSSTLSSTSSMLSSAATTLASTLGFTSSSTTPSTSAPSTATSTTRITFMATTTTAQTTTKRTTSIPRDTRVTQPDRRRAINYQNWAEATTKRLVTGLNAVNDLTSVSYYGVSTTQPLNATAIEQISKAIASEVATTLARGQDINLIRIIDQVTKTPLAGYDPQLEVTINVRDVINLPASHLRSALMSQGGRPVKLMTVIRGALKN